MARIRSIKPAFFRHRRLYLGEKETGLPLRIAFAGLWTCADREGRFRWEPDELKLDCLPYDELDFLRVLDALLTRGFIIHYACEDREYGVIPGFKQHQVINNREAASEIPEPPREVLEKKPKPDASATRASRVPHASPTPLVQVTGEGKGREGNAPDAHASPPDPEAELFRRGREVLGKQSGGLVAKLLAAKHKNIALARAAIEQASTKSDAREYIGRIISGPQQVGQPNWLDGIEGVI